ncbi:hypothetical protein ESZ50_00085 [Weissella muntiaci]|uniref:DUF4064 domain-containing protein n=1 Tax=Weissella muntiaci TaxID=2508881 RepID=A0A6C2CA97_9LACO|nr:hypothetical protein [Weissella muntiaci]TYC50968.1 hypothetical protein ESZ50_00085 [Weissella muntiaci]
MNLKYSKLVFSLNIIQAFVYIVGFVASVIYNTIDQISWLNIYHLSSFTGTMYWSVVSMLSIIGFVFSLYILITTKLEFDKKLGFILSIVGFLSPIIFSFFLIIPGTILILAAIFTKQSYSKK